MHSLQGAPRITWESTTGSYENDEYKHGNRRKPEVAPTCAYARAHTLLEYTQKALGTDSFMKLWRTLELLGLVPASEYPFSPLLARVLGETVWKVAVRVEWNVLWQREAPK